MVKEVADADEARLDSESILRIHSSSGHHPLGSNSRALLSATIRIERLSINLNSRTTRPQRYEGSRVGITFTHG